MEQDTINIPTEILNGSLTPEEIGTIVILMALPRIKNNFNWTQNKQFAEIVERFISEGIVTIVGEDKQKLDIDLTWI